MPNETPELTPRDVDHIMADWQDEAYHRELAEREAAHDSDASTDKLLGMVREDKERVVTERPKPVFEIPPDAKVSLDSKREEYGREFDRLSAQGIFTSAQIREKLAKQGLHPIQTAEEIEAHEVARIASNAGSLHTEKPSKPKTSKRRSLGPSQLDIADGDKRVESQYDQ